MRRHTNSSSAGALVAIIGDINGDIISSAGDGGCGGDDGGDGGGDDGGGDDGGDVWLTSLLQPQWATSPETCTPLLLYSRAQNTKTSFRDGGVGMGEGALHPQGPDPEARRPRPANREPANKQCS